MNKKKYFSIILIVIGSVGFGFAVVYNAKNPSLYALDQKYRSNPALLQRQDTMTPSDRDALERSLHEPLQNYLPYSDGNIHIDSQDDPHQILVQYTGTEASAKAAYQATLKKYVDTGANYTVTYQKVSQLPEVDD